MASIKAPKPCKLDEIITFSAYESWKDSIEFYLSCDADFLPFLDKSAKWAKITPNDSTRGFTDQAGGKKLTTIQQAAHLNRMLGFIAQHVPHFLSTDIKNNSTSIDSVWHIIRKYYNFQQSEVQMANFLAITWDKANDERPERLYQRLIAHVQDNLLKKESPMKYDGQDISENEVMSPTTYRLIVLRWMELIHPDLPALVIRTFAHDLETRSLKDLQPQICNALGGFLDELKANADIRASRAYTEYRRRPQSSSKQYPNMQKSSQYPKPQYNSRQYSNYRNQGSDTSKSECWKCMAHKRPYNHDIARCDYVSRAELRNLVRSCRVEMGDDEILEDNMEELHLDDSQE